jgi:hypothetical protein
MKIPSMKNTELLSKDKTPRIVNQTEYISATFHIWKYSIFGISVRLIFIAPSNWHYYFSLKFCFYCMECDQPLEAEEALIAPKTGIYC